MKPQRLQLPDGYALARYDELDSTNLEAGRRAKEGETGPLWIWARCQTAGRGRLGRHWVSEAGNLYASLLISLAPTDRPPDLSFVAALAVHSTAEDCLPPEARALLKLKWPNDLLLDSQKSAGILIEQAGTNRVAVGCGLNLGRVPQDGLRRPATGLKAYGSAVGPEGALEYLAEHMDRWLRTWRRDGFEAIRAAWLERAAGVGEMITANQETGSMHGQFTGLDENGALMLQLADGEITRILAADVELPS